MKEMGSQIFCIVSKMDKGLGNQSKHLFCCSVHEVK